MTAPVICIVCGHPVGSPEHYAAIRAADRMAALLADRDKRPVS